MKSTLVLLIACWTIQSIVLENVTYPFLKPNNLDVKLGTVLYDETASPEKVEEDRKRYDFIRDWRQGDRIPGLPSFLHLDNAYYTKVVGI